MPFAFQQVRGELDNPGHFQDVVNTPWHDDARCEKFSEAECQRRYAVTREAMAKRGPTASYFQPDPEERSAKPCQASF